VGIGLAAVAVVLGAGTLGYSMLGLTPLAALYQTVVVVSTVGFSEEFRRTTASEVFTIVLILAGVGTVLFAFGEVLEVVIAGALGDVVARRKMERDIERMRDHVVVCGWGRIGRAVVANLVAGGQAVVVVDADPTRLDGETLPHVVGDATEDAVLRRAGIERARGLAAFTSNDATNVYLTLSGRSLAPDLFILARARLTESEPKLRRAGADRVINPQAIGGARAAAFLLHPHAAEFIDVVTHDADTAYRLADLVLTPTSPFIGRTLRDAHIRDRSGALVLAVRLPDGRFLTNPDPDRVLTAGDVLILIGTDDQLTGVRALAAASEPS
jgi:voltage-gated potassium channel